MANVSDTSITKTQAQAFNRNAENMAELTCSKIKGFYLVKTQKGATWRFRYTDFAGKRRKLNLGKFDSGTDDRTKAADLAEKYRGQISEGIDPAAVIDSLKSKFKDAADSRDQRLLQSYLDGPYTKYQGRKKDEGKHTVDLIRRAFADFLMLPMDEISENKLKNWQETYRVINADSIRAHSTIVRAFGALRTMLRHAVKNKVIELDPTGGFTLEAESDHDRSKRQDGSQHTNRRMLTDDELAGINKGIQLYREQFIEKRERSISHGRAYLQSLKHVAFPHWFFPFFRLAAYTGMRPGDLYSLNWQELNINFKRLVKVPSKSRHHANPSQVDIPLDENIYGVMKAWHEQLGSPSSGLVFPSNVTGNQMDKKAHVKHWKSVLTLGNIKTSIDFYSLRHHYISKLVAGGIPLFTVAKLAGHKSIKMIEEHYGHLAPNAAAEALSLISGDFVEAGNGIHANEC
jgi:integrase